jgi:uncharacterized protein YrrD
MLKGKEIIGKSIVSYETGQKFDRVKDLIFDQDSGRLLGFLIDEYGWFSSARVLMLKDVQVIGPDALIVPSRDTVVKASDNPEINRIVLHNNVLDGTRIMTTDGRTLGTMVDLYFDERTGEIEGYEVSGGVFSDAYSGRSFVPAPQAFKIGEDVAFVPPQTAQLMEEQVGGIKAAVQNASEKVQETAQDTGGKLQEFGAAASERVKDTTQTAGEKLGEARRGATSSITNTVIQPEEQKTYVTGKTAKRSVIAPEGGTLVLEGQEVTSLMADSAEHLGILDELYRATGGTLSEPLGQRAQSATASFTVEQAEGRRVQYLVQSNEGLIVAAPGQIVTPLVIERAKIYHREQVLLQAVGLSPNEAARDRTGNAVNVAGERFKATAQSTGEQLQGASKSLWAKMKDAINDLQERNLQAKIQGALGRPVTRVILDKQDGVILNVGELITHEAISSAREAGVLDPLLSSVYNKKPELSLEDLRAPDHGKAAL